jgi:bifunctional DNA-binding transcriptional regulator/antitoxin component of YhaV-PrlF toxin-antitoxin module
METEFEIRKVQGLVGETSFSIILPKVYATKLGIEKGDFLKCHVENNRLVLEKAVVQGVRRDREMFTEQKRHKVEGHSDSCARQDVYTVDGMFNRGKRGS